VASCTTSSATGAKDDTLAKSTRGIVGTSLPGTIGKTKSDQNNIDDTIAGLCVTGAYTKSECLRHQLAVRAAINAGIQLATTK